MRTVCSTPGCGAWATGRGKCDVHRRAADAARGTNQERGYDQEHRSLRAAWSPFVALGVVLCWRCGQRITAVTPWDLGHDDDRELVGPEHAGCNRAVRAHAVVELTAAQLDLQETSRRLSALLAGDGRLVVFEVVERAFRRHVDVDFSALTAPPPPS